MSKKIIYIENESKEEKYLSLLPQIESLIGAETDFIANLANVTAVLKQAFGHFWVGFYLIKGDELVLAPFQGEVACTRITFGKGVCGTAWKERRTIIVPDVNQFAGHIACSSRSRSEIVVPLFNNGEIVGVLDIDSEKLNNFDDTDAKYLQVITTFFKNN